MYFSLDFSNSRCYRGDMKTKRDAAILVPVDRAEREQIRALSQNLGLSTQAFVRLLFNYALADIGPISYYLWQRRKQLGMLPSSGEKKSKAGALREITEIAKRGGHER
jgi:hypothetical protein